MKRCPGCEQEKPLDAFYAAHGQLMTPCKACVKAGHASDHLRRTPDQRFLSKVERRGECLIWIGSRDKRGYGHFYFDGKVRKAHRVAWVRARGPIPEGLEIHHRCPNRACVNVDHLELVTRLEHGHLDGFAYNAPRAHRAKTHCPQGHAYSPENTYVGPSGSRFCRACHRASERRRKARARAASV